MAGSLFETAETEPLKGFEHRALNLGLAAVVHTGNVIVSSAELPTTITLRRFDDQAAEVVRMIYLLMNVDVKNDDPLFNVVGMCK